MSFLIHLLYYQNFEEDFYSVIELLKQHHALPQQAFMRALPYFSFTAISKESQIKELFYNSCNLNLCKDLLRNIFLSNDMEPETLSGRLSRLGVMNFAQIVLYKVLPCPDANCPRCPREIVTHNQYKDSEYECPFYHHERDMRRIVITTSMGEEFVYKANYYEEGRKHSEKEKYSQNYFESMFHPLYYKMFKCKREYCKLSHFCPFFHNQDEKRIWDSLFSTFVGKDRISYVKDKQKYYESSSSNSVVGEGRQVKAEILGEHEQYDRTRQKNVKGSKTMGRQYQGNVEKSEKVKVFGGKRWEDWKEGSDNVHNMNSSNGVWNNFHRGNKEFTRQEVC